MNSVTFPGLNLNLQISRIAISIGSIEIYWYAILMTMSFVIALIIYKIRDGKYGIKFDNILDLAILVIPISIISARLYYVLFKLDYYFQNPIEILDFRNGGLAIYGGIIGGTICCYLYCKRKKINFTDLLDFIVVCLPMRTINWKMGQFYKYRSIWNGNLFAMENGYFGSGKIHRSSSNFFI